MVDLIKCDCFEKGCPPDTISVANCSCGYEWSEWHINFYRDQRTERRLKCWLPVDPIPWFPVIPRHYGVKGVESV